MEKADIGLIGLAVMGENLVLNMESKGFTVAVFNRTVSKVDDFINGRAKGKKIVGTHSIEEFVQALKTPRKIMLMVKAGQPVDDFIELLLPHVEKRDIIIDGGNSFFQDTIRRAKYVEGKGFLYIGTGVSGGEEGALKGPAIMPGGSKEAWEHIKSVFQSIAAKVRDKTPCCAYIGENGAGHYVKMVHNGIEYGDMQLISEAYFLMKELLGMKVDEMHKVFAEWNKSDLDSYLIDITANILSKKDAQTGKPIINLILDTAEQKGTGKWTSQSALDLGVPAATIAEAVFARCISGLKEERTAASKVLKGPEKKFEGSKKTFIKKIHDALYASKICSYAQGFQLMKSASAEYKWNLNFGEIALIWRNGCIIRAQFLERIKDAFTKNPGLQNLLLDQYFKEIVISNQKGWREVVSEAVKKGIPIPAFSSALNYYDSYRTERLSANMIQAQRDYFGAHTYERVDKPRKQYFHTNWLE
ncbi:phosphogluconate dehydrogenase (NADP(+)-dependent, decarboxylating) [Candidatus Desantisbacteria bacterium CG07_land_8_20_14_0_80_39_15]|uniref:6-phosphogluconate dehydrogenase, decarboxylating n=3 Tax=unclassified Candidatus Desantisiibacteriota TaxID=3106372 RepID=A0A2H9PBF1_9BACT|nr:MAG: phosphogluconate dehydrogenase (NADP(+)-dependent, decarboxylating) [Candidatus Desantisbacteria bacterium CG07_land_8_20_14_0_80_39_15]PIZ16129.1 MAG: phosphogluconate dehydrogenase (NADP(+)-dependent, decarboxylating) [Candidatus Desantisbacteria bacterium CG_4_10_14_0_8_um_filter_39_17]